MVEVPLHGIEALRDARSRKEIFTRKLLAHGLDKICTTCRFAVASEGSRGFSHDSTIATLRCDERSGSCPDAFPAIPDPSFDGMTSTINKFGGGIGSAATATAALSKAFDGLSGAVIKAEFEKLGKVWDVGVPGVGSSRTQDHLDRITDMYKAKDEVERQVERERQQRDKPKSDGEVW
jgi:hypothetical protein